MYPHLQILRPLALTGALVSATVLATSTIVVAPGDTLSELAETHDTTVAELLEWNDLSDPDRVLSGATLIVSDPDAAAPAAAGTHLVTAGDTLSALAIRFSTSLRALVAANDLSDPDRIYVGQRLALSGSTATTTTVTPTTTHTVVPGDTLSTIAEQYRVKTGVLAADNGISNPDHIVIGMVLTIGAPAAAPADEPATPTTTAPPTPTPTTTAPDTTTTTAPPTTVPTTTAPTTTAPPASPGTPRAADEVLLVPMFARWSEVYNVPQDLLEAIAWRETSWTPTTVGANGNQGIMQLSAERITLIEGGLLGRDMDALDAEDGIQMGARYLRYLIDRSGTERDAIAAWRQGLSGVQANGISADGAAYADAIEEIRRQRS